MSKATTSTGRGWHRRGTVDYRNFRRNPAEEFHRESPLNMAAETAHSMFDKESTVVTGFVQDSCARAAFIFFVQRTHSTFMFIVYIH